MTALTSLVNQTSNRYASGWPEKRRLRFNPKTGFSHTVRSWLCLLLCCLASACAPGRDLPDLPPIVAGDYRLGPGDVVRLITFGEDSLTAEFRVSDSGTIALPLVGAVAPPGLSPDAWPPRSPRPGKGKPAARALGVRRGHRLSADLRPG